MRGRRRMVSLLLSGSGGMLIWYGLMSLVCCMSLLAWETAGASVSEGNTKNSSRDKKADLRKKRYNILDSEDIVIEMKRMAREHPDLVTLETAQESFGLPAAGGKEDCPFEGDTDGCLNWILTIDSHTSETSAGDEEQLDELPEVFLSGCVHGDERVGPTAVLETAKLLVQAAACEGTLSDECRQSLMEESDMDDEERLWMARLALSRRIVVVPMANALGYFQNTREEAGTDPNRDFPFEVTNPAQCMQTIAARTINEIYRQHMFQLSLTFHGGMEIVAYEWGSPSYGNSFSPDHLAQIQIANSYSLYGGKWKNKLPYSTNTMNRGVYPVNGGMEDWAYAASWDTQHVLPCEPKQYNGYDKEKTIYNNATHRAFNMLIETSNFKIPANNQLGYSQHYLAMPPPSFLNGHISRNIRLSLMAVELVQPYLVFQSVNQNPITQLQQYKLIIPPSLTSIQIVWTVGGAFTVDTTRLLYSLKDDLPHDFKPNTTHTNQLQRTDIVKGATRWNSNNEETNAFQVTIDTSTIPFTTKGQQLLLWATAQVDSEWGFTPPSDYAPHLPPQSHIVNARTNPDWKYQNNGKLVQGRIDWFSDMPLIIELGDENTKLSPSYLKPEKAMPPSSNDDTSNNNKQFLPVFAIAILGLGLVFIVFQIRRLRREDDDFQIVSAIDDDFDAEEGSFLSSSRSSHDEEYELAALTS